MKKAIGPSASKTAPLKSKNGDVITEPNKQMDRWAEHYSELYAKETVVTDAAIKSTEQMPVMDDLDTSPPLPWKSWKRQLSHSLVTRHPEMMEFPLKSSKLAKIALSPNTSTNFFSAAGRKAQYPKT